MHLCFMCVFPASTQTWGLKSTVMLWLLAGRESGSSPGTSSRTPTTLRRENSCAVLSLAPQRSGCSTGGDTDSDQEWTQWSDTGLLKFELLTAVVILQIPGVHFGPWEDTSDGCRLHHCLCRRQCGRARTGLELYQSKLGIPQRGVSCLLSCLQSAVFLPLQCEVKPANHQGWKGKHFLVWC